MECCKPEKTVGSISFSMGKSLTKECTDEGLGCEPKKTHYLKTGVSMNDV